MKKLYLILLLPWLTANTSLTAQQPFIGQIMFVPYTFSPSGWQNCDGALLPINENEALFALIGTTYGGDGENTFAVPDMRGRVLIDDGQGNNLSSFFLGQTGGAEAVQLTASQMPVHSHTVNAVTSVGNGSSPTGQFPANTAVLDKEYSNQAATTTMKTGMLSTVGNSQPHQNIQPYLTMKCVISLYGIYPSQN